MTQPFIELKKELKRAQRQIDLLCGGFGVGMEPTWGSLLDKVLSEIKQWEDEGEIREEKLEPVTVYYIGAAVTAAEGTPLPNILFQQFRSKFLTIIKTSVVPALRRYKQDNPEAPLSSLFKPLLEVSIR